MDRLAAVPGRLRRSLVLLAVAAAALGLAACGSGQKIVTTAETEGIYVDVGALNYQVQISRELNGRVLPDETFLLGLPPGEQLRADETWFGVFVRAQNETDRPALLASDFKITDTQENVYRPIPLGPANRFAYRPEPVPANDVYPPEDAVSGLAGVGGTNGGMLLFKIPFASLQNRPLEMSIGSPGSGEEATVTLDV